MFPVEKERGYVQILGIIQVSLQLPGRPKQHPRHLESVTVRFGVHLDRLGRFSLEFQSFGVIVAARLLPYPVLVLRQLDGLFEFISSLQQRSQQIQPVRFSK